MARPRKNNKSGDLPLGSPVADYRHESEKRKNNPPAKIAAEGFVPLVPKAEYAFSPRRPPELRFDPHGAPDQLPELIEKATREPLTPEEARVLAEALRNHEPWLEWAGKREQKSFAVDPVALHIHERVSAQAILKVAAREDVNRSLFADPEQEYNEAVQFYRHNIDWTNRLILGDSLQVMSSLAHREDLAGKVQMIYMDPPYLTAAKQIGDGIIEAYERALVGIRARLRGEQPIPPQDPYLLRDLTTLLMDTGMRPDECYRLRWEHIRNGSVHVPYGKTANARRVIPLTPRVLSILETRQSVATTEWVFPAPTRTGHIEKSSLKRQHPQACELGKVEPFLMYDLRHTCLTRWSAHMDPYTLAYLAGHSDFSTTKRYVHPQADAVRAALDRARAQLHSKAVDQESQPSFTGTAN